MNSKECLEKLYDGYQYGMAGRSYYDIIKQDLDRLEKLEKIIEILKENLQLVLKKDIDPLLNRKVYAVGISKNYKIYSGFETTQEDYELIKEVLKNE